MTNLLEGDRAPEFTLKALDGKSHSLSMLLQGGPVVAAFFKVSCPVCQFTLPFLQRMHERYGSGPAIVLAISQDNLQDTREFNREYGVRFTTLIDEHPYPVSNIYGLTSVPTIFLIEPDRTIKVSCMGFSKNELERIASELANRMKIEAAPFFRDEEVVPAHKPG